MASDRSIYDQGFYLQKTSESSKPLAYMLQVDSRENCIPCGDTPNVSKHEERVNLESDLLGITRKLSKDPKSKYQMNPKIADTLKNYNPPYLCERNLSHPSFVNQSNPNKYMEDLRKGTISQ